MIHADGACRGNPGPAGVGVVIESRTGRLLEELTRFLGHATNNIAEYNALILGLEAARRLQAADVTVRMDSQLVVRQVGGSYKVRDEKLRPLHARATQLASGFRHFRIEHVPRAANDAADRLANRAIEEAVWRNGAPDDMVL